eukprot:TRINITY_DN1451_c3_g3_i1.p1 TRINITY_DN1451_c3_g3~~TRINITY_DN1451_c3_g3_i1.p1  ORF type:complete len:112 (+),score=9.89 TRINITY_DN1451_c3_g3_i1:72-407(+)
MQAQHKRKVLKLYRGLLKLATKFPESEVAWENNRIPMSDELRVEIRTAFKDNRGEVDPRRMERQVNEANRIKKMLEVIIQDGFTRMYSTVREYHTWGALSVREMHRLKEKE